MPREWVHTLGRDQRRELLGAPEDDDIVTSGPFHLQT